MKTPKRRKSDSDDAARALIQPVKRASLLQRLRNNFLTGIVVVAPVGITAYLTWTIVDYVDRQVLPQVIPLLPEAYRPENLLPFSLPGLGLVVFGLFLIAIGSLTKNFFGREILRLAEGWVDRMPVVRSIYNGLKQIAETIFTQSQNSFEKACLVEYPRRGIWAVAFVSTEARGEVREKTAGTDPDDTMLSVFLPTTPNPTSGFLLFVPKKDVVILDMTVEEAAKLVISAGLVAPPRAADAAGPGASVAQPPAAESRPMTEEEPVVHPTSTMIQTPPPPISVEPPHANGGAPALTPAPQRAD